MTYRQLRNQVVRLRQRHASQRRASLHANQRPGRGFEVFAESLDVYRDVHTAQEAAAVADELATKYPGETLHVWTPGQQHAYSVEAAGQEGPMLPYVFNTSKARTMNRTVTKKTRVALGVPRKGYNPDQVWLILLEGDTPKSLPSPEQMEGTWENSLIGFEAQVADMLDPALMEISGVVTFDGRPSIDQPMEDAIKDIVFDMLADADRDLDQIYISVTPSTRENQLTARVAGHATKDNSIMSQHKTVQTRRYAMEFKLHAGDGLGLDEIIEARDQVDADAIAKEAREQWMMDEAAVLQANYPEGIQSGEPWTEQSLWDYVEQKAGEWIVVPITYITYEAHGSRVAGYDTDESIVVELVQWIQNSQVPYQQLQSVERNLVRKMAQDRYDPDLAVKGLMYVVESGAKDYAREFGGSWHEMFPRDIRLLVAQELRDEFEAEVNVNPQDYEQHVHKKHLPRWQERYQPDRDAAVTSQENEIMTRNRPPSRNRRRRLATRVERARTRVNRKRRVVAQDQRQQDQVDRLELRCASLDRLLQRAELELRAAQRAPQRVATQVPRTERASRPTRRIERPPRPRPSQRVREREARVHEIRAQLATEERRLERQERRVARPRRRATELRQPRGTRTRAARTRAARATRRPARLAKTREAAPKMLRGQQSGKLYVRVD